MRFEHLEDLSIHWQSWREKYSGKITLKKNPKSISELSLELSESDCYKIYLLLQDIAIEKMEQTLQAMKSNRDEECYFIEETDQ